MKILLEKTLGNQFLIWGITLLLSVIYVYLGFKYIHNFPLNADDAVICISDLLKYINNEINALDYLLARKNNNPTLIMRLFALMDYKITGELNFKHIIHFSNLGYVLFVIFLTYLYRYNKLAIIIPILLLNPIPNYIYWASATACYPYTLIILFFALYLLNKHSNVSLLIAVLLIPVLTYSFSNGFIGVFVASCFAIYLWSKKKITLPYLSVYLVVSIFCIVSFLMGNEGELSSGFNLKFIGFGLAFAGNLGKYLILDEETVSIILTLICFGLLIPILIKQFGDSGVILKLSILAFILGSGFAAGYVRCQFEMFCTPTAQRYEIFGVFAFTFFCLIISRFNKHYLWLLPLILIMSLIKITNSISLFAKEEFNIKFNTYLSTFADEHKIRGLNKEQVESCKIDYQEALDRQLMRYGVDFSDFNFKDVYGEDCNDKESFNLKIINAYNREDVTLIDTRIGLNNFVNFYYKHNGNCMPIKVFMRPTNNWKWHRAFLVIPHSAELKKNKNIVVYAN